MTRRLVGLLATLCIASACKEEPVGQMQPIIPPPGTPTAPAKPAEEPKPAPAPEPPPDPSKVTLRWKLDAPLAFRLTTSATESAAPAPAAAAPKGKKGKPAPAPTASSKTSESSLVFVMRKTESGDYAFRIYPQGKNTPLDEGTMSERGFVLDGLPGPLRNTAVLALELPRDPVGPGSTWALGMDLVDLGAVTHFVEKKAERKNQVKLAALTPEGNGEQVATIEYTLSETLSGELRGKAPAPAPKGGRPGKDEAKKDAAAAKKETEDEGGTEAKEEDTEATGTQAASADVQVKGRGEFLVKAGHWRSWQATLTTRTTGATLPGTLAGERTLSLTPLEPVPAELLPPPAPAPK